jgi:hypothetical protein
MQGSCGKGIGVNYHKVSLNQSDVNKIRAEGSNTIASFSNLLLNGSIGYNFGLVQNIYLSPWAGLSLKVAGDKDIVVQNKIYNLPFLNPEMSLKLGFHF